MRYNIETLPRMEAEIEKKTSRDVNEQITGYWRFINGINNETSIGSFSNIDGGNASSIYLTNQIINGGGA